MGKDESISPAPLPCPASSPAGAQAWDLACDGNPTHMVNQKETLASATFLFCLEILSKLHSKLMPGTRHNFIHRSSWDFKEITEHRSKIQKHSYRMRWILKTVANDTGESQKCCRIQWNWAESQPPLPFPQDAQTLFFRGFTPSVVEFYCYYMGRRKQNAIFLKMKAKLLPERER